MLPWADAFAAAALLGALLSGCGSSKPPEPEPEAAQTAPSPDPGDRRNGAVSFHYANKSTNASMQLDLGSEEVYLEMSGKPVKPEDLRPAERSPDPAQAPAAQGAASPQIPQPPPAPQAQPLQGMQPQPMPAPASRPSSPRSADGPAREAPQEKSQADDGDENGNGYAPDVTDKVLSGIRKAQEFFYQKRYPEALEMVRQSLDARPTAEGHALAGSIHYMLGQPGLAKRHWQQALRLNPDMPAVVNMLEKISTPGGRGSPFPRPLVSHRPAPAPSGEVMDAARPPEQAPYPEEYGNTDVTTPAPPQRPGPEAAPPAEPAPADTAKPHKGMRRP